MRVGGFTFIIESTFTALCIIGRHDEDWKIHLTRRQKGIVAFWSIVQAAYIAYGLKEPFFAARFLLCVLAGCLLMACVMDLWEHAVYFFVWMAGGGAAGLLLLLGWAVRWRMADRVSCSGAGGLLLFLFLQYLLFARMYGRADCHAFSVCAMAQTALGMEFQDHVMHMAAAFIGLAAVQAFRKNIAPDGNLKKPVPLLPYITAAFWCCLAFGRRTEFSILRFI